MVTRDEVPDPQDLALWLEVNGHRFQDGNTSTMIFDVKTIVSFASCYMTLEPGDVIPTGTPPGVGAGQKPQRFLQAGDVMRLGVAGSESNGRRCAPGRADARTGAHPAPPRPDPAAFRSC